MNVVQVVGGALLAISPFWHRRQVRRIRRRIDASGGDGERFEQRMTTPAITAAFVVVAILGLANVVYGLMGG